MQLTAEQVRAIFMALDYQEEADHMRGVQARVRGSCEPQPVIVTDADIDDNERFAVALVANAGCFDWPGLLEQAQMFNNAAALDFEWSAKPNV